MILYHFTNILYHSSIVTFFINRFFSQPTCIMPTLLRMTVCLFLCINDEQLFLWICHDFKRRRGIYRPVSRMLAWSLVVSATAVPRPRPTPYRQEIIQYYCTVYSIAKMILVDIAKKKFFCFFVVYIVGPRK